MKDEDKGIINVLLDISDYSRYYNDRIMIFIMTEEKMKEYPVLYNLYIISIMLTKDSAQLSKDEYGYYISKRTIWKNLYITKNYNGEKTHMAYYPVMSYELSTDTHIRANMYIISDAIMIKDYLIVELIDEESKKIEEDLCCLENDVKMAKITSLYINKIVPENFPDDLKNIIIANIICS
jgi:hypothetical protein